MLDKKAQNMMVLKCKFVQNVATLDVTNTSIDMVIFHPKEMFDILDLRLVGYYKIKQGILQQIEVYIIDLSQLIFCVDSAINLQTH